MSVAAASVIGPEYVLPKLWTMKCSLPPLLGTMKSCGAESMIESGPYLPDCERHRERERLERRAGLAAPLGGQVERELVVVLLAVHDRSADHRPHLVRSCCRSPPATRSAGSAGTAAPGRRPDRPPAGARGRAWCGSSARRSRRGTRRRCPEPLVVEPHRGEDLRSQPAREVRRRGRLLRLLDRPRSGAARLIHVAYCATRDVVLLEHVLEHEVPPSLRGRLGARAGRTRSGRRPSRRAARPRRASSTDAHVGRGASPQPESVWPGRDRGVVAVDLAEVHARGGLDPVGAVAEVDRVQVLGEDLLSSATGASGGRPARPRAASRRSCGCPARTARS